MSSADESNGSPNANDNVRTGARAATASGSGQTNNAEMVRSVVATVMENQAETITRMTNEAMNAFMRNSEAKISEDIEQKLRKKEKISEPTFKGEGNKDQYKHQRLILENMEDIGSALNRNEVEKAKELLEEGKNLVQKRMKLIRIAEREDWGTVREYVSDDLADDTDDEKSIARAVKSSEAKKEKVRKQKARLLNIRKGTGRTRDYKASYGRKSSDYKPQSNCWTCGRSGHTSRVCYRNTKRDYNRYNY